MQFRFMPLRSLLLSLVLAGTAAGPALSQEGGAAKALDIELNTLAPSQRGCLLTFVAGNGLGHGVSKVSFEFVIFNEKGTVERLALLDFRDLPEGKSKVRQFDVPGIRCENVKRLLINDAPVCEGEGISSDACMGGIVTRSSAAATLEG